MRTWWLWGLLTLAACGSDKGKSDDDNEKDAGAPAADAGATSSERLSADGRFFRDARGRAVILRGVNARVQGVFDVSFDDGRTAVEDVPSLTAKDCARMAELGFGIVRLPVQWSGIEPQRDHFDEAYLARVDTAVACLREQGIYVIVDLHQDAYSKEIGEDGAPRWAIVPEPEMLLEGPLTAEELSMRRSSKQVLDAFASFFDAKDAHGLQAQYIEMLEHVARHFADEEHVLGLDLFNEPLGDTAVIAPFQERAAQAVRAAAPSLIVFFEPTGLWTWGTGEGTPGAPFAVTGSVYAPHLYKLVIGGTDQDLMNVKRTDLLPQFELAASEAKAWKSAWMIGEFGGGPSTTNFAEYFRVHYDLQDEFLVSSALWLWKESTQGSWGLYDFANGSWKERAAMVEAVSRPYAMRIAGTPKSMRFDGKSLTFAYEAALDAANVVFVPERFEAKSVRCDGKAVTPRASGTRLEIDCAKATAHTVEIALQKRP